MYVRSTPARNLDAAFRTQRKLANAAALGILALVSTLALSVLPWLLLLVPLALTPLLVVFGRQSDAELISQVHYRVEGLKHTHWAAEITKLSNRLLTLRQVAERNGLDVMESARILHETFAHAANEFRAAEAAIKRDRDLAVSVSSAQLSARELAEANMERALVDLRALADRVSALESLSRSELLPIEAYTHPEAYCVEHTSAELDKILDAYAVLSSARNQLDPEVGVKLAAPAQLTS